MPLRQVDTKSHLAVASSGRGERIGLRHVRSDFMGLAQLPVTLIFLCYSCALVRFVPMPDDVEQIPEHFRHVGYIAVA